LKSLLGDDLPRHLLQRYRQRKKWRDRNSLVYAAIWYARRNDDALELGLLALHDRSKMVRYRACLLLACAQRKDRLGELQAALADIQDDAREDLLAAIDAVANENQNFFVDREHTGNITLNLL